jgi:hypothetical protein
LDSACGGGGGDGGGSASSQTLSSVPASAVASSNSSAVLSSVASSISSSSTSASSVSSISNQARVDAATSTAQNNSFCTAIQPFYWELGDKTQALASGSVGGNTYQANTLMNIASASKWIFGAYVVQARSGVLSASDINALTMRSGYTNFSETSCIRLLQVTQDAETVDQCLQSTGANGGQNGDYSAQDLNHFYYNGGHFQKLASTLGMGALNNSGLQTQVQSLLGSDFQFTYFLPQLAGGVNTSAANYAIFLRKILNNQLLIAGMLGQNVVCTNITSCPPAAYTPMPSTESWGYSLGHWVENDPTFGDGAFSSAGAFGFYPWIDSTKTLYGVLARKAAAGNGYESAACGRLIRKAWVMGVAQ